MNLGDGVLSPPIRAEAVGARLEVRFEDRFEHQLECCLDHSVPSGWDAEPALLRCARFRNQPLAYGQRPETAGLQINPHLGEKGLLAAFRLHRVGRLSVHSGRTSTLVAAHPTPGYTAAFPLADYYRGSVPCQAPQRTARCPDNGRTRLGSHVHHEPFDGGGAQLFPCNFALGTPQAFSKASASVGITPPQSRSRSYIRPRALRTNPYPPGLGWRAAKGGSITGSLRVTPFRLACQTWSVWRCHSTLSLSRLLPPSPALPGSGCLQLQRAAATARWWVLASHPVLWRLVAHDAVGPGVDQLALIQGAFLPGLKLLFPLAEPARSPPETVRAGSARAATGSPTSYGA